MLILCWLTFSYVLHSTESVTMCVCLIFIEIHYICMILTKFCSPPFEVISFRSCFSGSLPPPCWILPMAMDLFNKKNLSKFWQWHQLKCIHCVCVEKIWKAALQYLSHELVDPKFTIKTQLQEFAEISSKTNSVWYPPGQQNNLRMAWHLFDRLSFHTPCSPALNTRIFQQTQLKYT